VARLQAGPPRRRDLIPGRVKKFISSPKRPERIYLEATQQPNQWVPETLSLRAIQPGCKAEAVLPSSAEVTNKWSYNSTPPHAFRAFSETTLSIPLHQLFQLDSQKTILLPVVTYWVNVWQFSVTPCYVLLQFSSNISVGTSYQSHL
jgi:hypothetical protein